MSTTPAPRWADSLRAVLFDMDGVLVDSEEWICRAAIRMFADDHGTAVQPEDFLPFVGTGEDRYLGGVAEQHGVSLALPADKERTYAYYLDAIIGNLQPLAGVKEGVALLRARGLKLAVATSADRIKLDGNLAEIDLPPSSFDACISREDIRHAKPDPEIFQTAAEAVGIPAEQCLVMEDAETGARAAKAAGCWCVGITSSFSAAQLLRAGADITAPDVGAAVRALGWGP